MNKLLKEARVLLDQSLDPVYGKTQPHQVRVKAFLQKTKQKTKRKPSQVRLRRVSKRSTKNEETAKIREAVMDRRATGRCEYHYGPLWALRCEATAAHLDHWLSGAGRRRQMQSEETCWGLCPFHHGQRTKNYPTAAYWNSAFEAHCRKHGYSFTPHVVHEPIARKAQ